MRAVPPTRRCSPREALQFDARLRAGRAGPPRRRRSRWRHAASMRRAVRHWKRGGLAGGRGRCQRLRLAECLLKDQDSGGAELELHHGGIAAGAVGAGAPRETRRAAREPGRAGLSASSAGAARELQARATSSTSLPKFSPREELAQRGGEGRDAAGSPRLPCSSCARPSGSPPVSAIASVVAVGVVEHDDAFHARAVAPAARGNSSAPAPASCRVVLADRAADDDAGLALAMPRQHVVEDLAADVVEVDVDAVRRSAA